MATNTTGDRTNRLAGLRRFALGITCFNVIGQVILGFEVSWAQLLTGLATAYSMELLLEAIDAWAHRRTPQFFGGFRSLVDFLLSAHIAGMVIPMLLYPNELLWPVAFTAAVAIGSKKIFRAPVEKGSRHFFNPSNLGISVTLVLFPWIGIAPPYHFARTLNGAWDWILPVLIMMLGTLLNARFTGRLPLITAWVAGFALQGFIRAALFDASLLPILQAMTSPAFVLFTLYMVTDPATTPSRLRAQVAFGASLAAAYGVVTALHTVYGLFFGLVIVCAVRGLSLYVQAWSERRSEARARVAVPESGLVGRAA